MSFLKRKLAKIAKYLAACFVIYCLFWVAVITDRRPENIAKNMEVRTRDSFYETSVTTMRTIIAYSERKFAELNRPLAVTCDQIPIVPERIFNNPSESADKTWDSPARDWQKVDGTDLLLYAAYYDDRIQGQPFIRILGLFHGRQWGNRPQLYCQTRSQNPLEMDMEVVTAIPLEIWWHEWDVVSNETDTPVLISCSLSDELRGGYFVSVVKEPCDNPNNIFEISYYEIEDDNGVNFTICVKDMKLESDKYISNLIEWIELNLILGVDIIDIYVDNIHSDIRNILEFYRINGLVRIFKAPIQSSVERNLWQRRRDHIISYNDCLYRNLKKSKFIVPIDIDEIILPKHVNTWSELIDRLPSFGWNEKENSAILIRNVFFFDFLQSSINKIIIKNRNYTKADDVRLKVQNNLDKISKSMSTDAIDDSVAVKDFRQRCHKSNKLPESKYLNHTIRSAIVSPSGHYSKSIMLTKKVLTVFNHYPLSSLGVSQFGIWAAPFEEAQLNHYKENCNSTLVSECSDYARDFVQDLSVSRFRDQLTRALLNASCF